MNYISLKEASSKWEISVRRINVLCSEGRIPGAKKVENLWMIPESAQKPSDGRRKKAPLKEPGILIRNSTYIENHAVADLCDYDITLCKSMELFLRGDFENGFELLNSFTKSCQDKQYLLIAYYMMNYNSMFLADEKIVKHSKTQMNKLLNDPSVGELTKALVQLKNSTEPNPMFINIDQGILDDLYPYLSLSALRYNLIMSLKTNYLGNSLHFEISCRSLKEANCPEVYTYYHVVLAVYYSITGSNEYSRMHLEEAAKIALPRGWYTPFAEYALALNLDFINDHDHNAFQQINDLYYKILNSYQKLDIFPNYIAKSRSGDISDIQVAYQIACGKTNTEIADELGKSIYYIKKSIADIYAKTGFSTRAEIKDYVISHILL